MIARGDFDDTTPYGQLRGADFAADSFTRVI